MGKPWERNWDEQQQQPEQPFVQPEPVAQEQQPVGGKPWERDWDAPREQQQPSAPQQSPVQDVVEPDPYDTTGKSAVSLKTDMPNEEDPSLPLPLRIAQKIARPLFWDDGGLAEKGKQRGVVGNVAAGLYEGGQHIGSMVQRAAGLPERAEETLDKSSQYEQELQKGDTGIAGEVARTTRGVLSSAITSVTGAAIGGAPGAIFFASGSEMNSAINEGKKAGLEGADLNYYVMRTGAIEAGPASFMQAIGLPGAEGVIAKVFGKGVKEPAKRGILSALKSLGFSTATEIPEELVTEIGHNINTGLSGVDPNALSGEQLFDTVYNTTLQTVGTMGLFSAPNLAGATVDTLTGRSKAQQADDVGGPIETPVDIPLTPDGTKVDVLEKPEGAPDIPAPPDDVDAPTQPDEMVTTSEDQFAAVEAQALFGEEPEIDVPDVNVPPGAGAVSPGVSRTLDESQALLERAQQPTRGVQATTDDVLAGRTVDDVQGTEGAVPEEPDFIASKSSNHTVYFKGKRIEEDREQGNKKEQFKNAANRVKVNLGNLEIGFVKTPEGKYYEISDSLARAVPVTEEYVKNNTAPDEEQVSRITSVLSDVPKTDAEIAKESGISKDTVSKKLISLEQSGAVNVVIDKGRKYTANPSANTVVANETAVGETQTEPVADETPLGTPIDYTTMTRKELQQAAKDNGIKANMKSADIISELEAQDEQNVPPVPESEAVSEEPVADAGVTADAAETVTPESELPIDVQSSSYPERHTVTLEQYKSDYQKLPLGRMIPSYEYDKAISASKGKSGTQEFNDDYERNIRILAEENASRKHRKSVETALSEGKPVSDAVLADYPDLRDRVKMPTVEPVVERKPAKRRPTVFDVAEDKAAKEYVLEELDKAIAEAPDSAVQEPVLIRLMTDEEKKYPHIRNENINNLQKEYGGSISYYEGNGEIYHTPSVPTVTIELPKNGGKIKLINSKSNLADYKKRVGREFVTKVSTPTKKSKLKAKPMKASVPKLGKMSKASAAKVAWTFASQSKPNHPEEIKKPMQHKGALVGSDGFVLASMSGMATGKENAAPEPVVAYLDIKPDSVGTANTGTMINVLKSSALNGRNTKTELYYNKDKSIGVRSVTGTGTGTDSSVEPAEYTYNLQDGAEKIGMYGSGHLQDIFVSARQLGADTVSIGQDVAENGVATLVVDGKDFRFSSLSSEPNEINADFDAYTERITPAEKYAIRRDTAKRTNTNPASRQEIQKLADTAGLGYGVNYLLDEDPPGVPEKGTGRRMYSYAGIPLQDGDVIQAMTDHDKKRMTFWRGATMSDVAHEVLHVNITSVTPAEADGLAARYGQDWERKEELIARDAADYYKVMQEEGVLKAYYLRVRDAILRLMRTMGLSTKPVSVDEFFRSVYTGRRARRMRYTGGMRFASTGQQTQTAAELDTEYFNHVDSLDLGKAWRLIKDLAARKGWEYAAHHGSPVGNFTKFNTWGGAIFLSTDYETAKVYERDRRTLLPPPTARTRDFYVDPGVNPLDVDAQGNEWSNVPFEGGISITDSIVAEAQKRGHTSVKFTNIKDGTNNLSTVFAVFDSAQVKSADAVTRDEVGRIIPPSERFQIDNSDVRYAVKPSLTPKPPEVVSQRKKARGEKDQDSVAKRVERTWGVLEMAYRFFTNTDWHINESGEAGKLLFRLFPERINEAKVQAQEMVATLVKPLTTDQYNLASEYLSHAAAIESAQRAEVYDDPVEFNNNMEPFRHGWEQTVDPLPENASYEQFREWRKSVIDQMNVYMGQLEAEIAEQPAVQDMLEKRRAMVQATQQKIVDRKLLPQNMLENRENYFHNEIHMAGRIIDKYYGGASKYSKQIRSFMKKRTTGQVAYPAELDPSSDYLLSELAWLTDANIEIAKADWWKTVEKAFGHPIQTLKQKCRELNYTSYVGGKANRDRLRQINAEQKAIYTAYIMPDGKIAKLTPEDAQAIYELTEEAAGMDGTWRLRKYMGHMLAKIKEKYTFEYDPFADEDSHTLMFNELSGILIDPAAPGDMKYYVSEIFRTMSDVRNKIKTSLEGDPNKQYQVWTDIIPEGYDIVQPDEGHVMYPILSMSAKAMKTYGDQATKVAHAAGEAGIPIEDLIVPTPPEGRLVYVPGGPKPQLVVPQDIANKINFGMKTKKRHFVAQMLGNATSQFQKWVLFNWATYPIYAIKNTVSDAENFVNGLGLNPKQAAAFTGDMRRATSELYQYVMKKDFENMSPELRAFRSSGGLGSDLMTSELLQRYDPTEQHALNKVTNSLDYLFGYKYTQQANAFRENLLRYAWYLHAKRNFDETGTLPHWGGSKAEEIVDVLNKLGSHEAASLWATNQMLNYQNLSLFGQWLRDSKMGIFYSFTELSVRSVANNARNSYTYGKDLQNNLATAVRENPMLNVPVMRQLALGATYGAQAMATATMAAKIGAIWGAAALWNNVLFGDDEDELPDYYKFMPHINLGRNSDGSVRVLRNMSMLGSVMEFMGMYEAARMLTDTGLEKTNLADLARQTVMGGPVQRMVGHSNPFFKTGIELITGQSWFPDPTRPRPMDRFDLLTNMFGLQDVGLALKGAIYADGTRARGHPVLRSIRAGIVYPKEEKRYEIYRLYDAYRAEVGLPDESGNFRGGDKFLKQIRHAAINDDPKAFRENVHSLWINRGMHQGKVTRSINDNLRYLDPMERIPNEHRKPFLEFMTPRQREAYKETVQYGKELRQKILQMYQMYGVMQ